MTNQQTNSAGSFVRFQAPDSCDPIVVAQSAVLVAGSVLGQITASGKYVQINPAATDGSQNVAGVLFDWCDASSTDEPAVCVSRNATVKGSDLVWPVGITTPHKSAAIGQLNELGVIVR